MDLALEAALEDIGRCVVVLSDKIAVPADYVGARRRIQHVAAARLAWRPVGHQESLGQGRQCRARGDYRQIPPHDVVVPLPRRWSTKVLSSLSFRSVSFSFFSLSDAIWWKQASVCILWLRCGPAMRGQVAGGGAQRSGRILQCAGGSGRRKEHC